MAEPVIGEAWDGLRPVVVKELEAIEGTPVMELALESARSIQSLYTGDVYLPTGTESAFYVEEEGEVVALAVWFTWDGMIWLAQVWTREDRRGQGLYRALFDQAKRKAQALGLNKIGAGVSGENHISRKTHEALGMSIEAVTYQIQL